jgi:hypothetical protein
LEEEILIWDEIHQSFLSHSPLLIKDYDLNCIAVTLRESQPSVTDKVGAFPTNCHFYLTSLWLQNMHFGTREDTMSVKIIFCRKLLKIVVFMENLKKS